MITTLTSPDELRNRLAAWRRAGERIAFVPTMGNLHAGHLALVEAAAGLADRVVVSIFVNPTQFNDDADYTRYPRTLAADCERLQATAADLVFAPAESAIYPFGREATVRIEVPGPSAGLEGAFRPGHFTGVATVVCKLLNIVAPDIAVFGEKDLQQLRVIERLVTDLRLSVGIVGVPTVREADGLAMSSRNAYLDANERRLAAGLYETLSHVAMALIAGQGTIEQLETDGMARLRAAGFRPEYVAIRRWHDLGPATGARELAVLAAAWLGRARLIDNLPVTVPVAVRDSGGDSV